MTQKNPTCCIIEPFLILAVDRVQGLSCEIKFSVFQLAVKQATLYA